MHCLSRVGSEHCKGHLPFQLRSPETRCVGQAFQALPQFRLLIHADNGVNGLTLRGRPSSQSLSRSLSPHPHLCLSVSVSLSLCVCLTATTTSFSLSSSFLVSLCQDFSVFRSQTQLGKGGKKLHFNLRSKPFSLTKY